MTIQAQHDFRTLAGPPSVLVLTPMKDAEAYLPRYFELLERLDYPKSRLSLGFLVGNSADGTFRAMEDRVPILRQGYSRVQLLQRDFHETFRGPRHHPRAQLERRARIARARNHLLSRCLRDEEWVLWLDADLEDYPLDLLRLLLGTGKDIVAAHCLESIGERTFDLNTFINDAGSPLHALWRRLRHTRDGLYQPPIRAGRKYLGDFRSTPLVQVDGVGGTVLLIRADLHRDGLNFPPYPLDGLIETEGLAAMARRMDVSCWGMPDVIVRHMNRHG